MNEKVSVVILASLLLINFGFLGLLYVTNSKLSLRVTELQTEISNLKKNNIELTQKLSSSTEKNVQLSTTIQKSHDYAKTLDIMFDMVRSAKGLPTVYKAKNDTEIFLLLNDTINTIKDPEAMAFIQNILKGNVSGSAETQKLMFYLSSKLVNTLTTQ